MAVATTDQVLAAYENLLLAQANYQKALTAYNKANFFEKTFGAGSELKRAKQALDEAQENYDRMNMGLVGSEQSKTASSQGQFTLLIIIAVCAVILGVTIYLFKK